jgi:Uma2 family endonuclease
MDGDPVSIETWPDHLLTLSEWEALPEDSMHRIELVEGVLLVAPRPASVHQMALFELGRAIAEQLPADLIVLLDVEILIDAVLPPTVRVPDLVVVARLTARANVARFKPADVLLAVEVISPGSQRTDRVTKAAEYAEAEIPHYWIVDLDPSISLTALRLVDGAYVGDSATGGAIDLTSVGPIRLDLPSLLDPRQP